MKSEPEVMSRGDGPKIHYLSFIPFLHTLVPYPFQRQNRFFRFLSTLNHTSWPEIVMEKFVGIRVACGDRVAVDATS